MRRSVVPLALALAAGCRPSEPSAVEAPAADLIGARAWAGVPEFDAEQRPVVRLGGRAPSGLAVVLEGPGGEVRAATRVTERGEWTFAAVDGPVPPPGPGRIRLEVLGARPRVWDARWAQPPETLPAVAAVVALRGRHAEVLAAVERALPTASPRERLHLRVEGARARQASGDPQAAAAWLEAAAEAEIAGVPTEVTRGLRAAAWQHLRRHALADAAALLDRAEAADRALAHEAGLARTHYYRGLLARSSGDYRESTAQLRAAITEARALGDPANEAYARQALAETLQDQGRHAEALAELGAARPFLETAPAAIHAQFLGYDGYVRLRAMVHGATPADFPDVRARLLRARTLLRELRDERADADLTADLAWVALLDGRLDEARALVAEVRGAPTASPPARLAAGFVAAETHLVSGDAATALSAFEGLEAEARALRGDAELAWKCRHGAGRALRAMGRTREARAAFESASAALDRAASRTALHEARAPFFADRRAVLADTVSLLLAERDARAAFLAVDAAQARVLRALAGQASVARLDASGRAAWQRRLGEWQAARAAHEARADEGELLAGSARAAWAAERRARSDALVTDLDALYAWLESSAGASPTGPAGGAPPLTSLAAAGPVTPGVTSAAVGPVGSASALPPLGPREALLELASVGGRVHAFLVSESVVRHAEAPGDVLATFADFLREIDHLYVVPGGVAAARGLALAPWRGAPALAAFGFSELPFAGLLHEPARARTGPPLVVADPNGDLRHARAEGLAVAERLPGARVLAGADAARDPILRALDGAALFHFAGHGLLQADDPWSAHLRLAREETLRLEDLLVARPRAGVVVLSGCETGRARALSDHESVGLAEAWLLAGAHSVVVTDRDVPDEATARFVAAFYAAGGAEHPGPAFRHAALAAPADVGAAFRLVGRP